MRQFSKCLNGLRTAYTRLENLPFVGVPLRRLRYLIKWRFRYKHRPAPEQYWDVRIYDVIRCPDNVYIPRVVHAGSIQNGYQIMHNGIKIVSGGYYGEPVRVMLKLNQGIHEPQEERVFMEILKHLPRQAVMLELGSYWGFYSLWFHKAVQAPTCFLVEPEVDHLHYGQLNFAANQMTGTFLQAFVGARSDLSEDGTRIICVDDFVAEHAIEHLHVLHADIQGAEHDMLLGAATTIAAQKVDYILISTHTNELHCECRSFLTEQGYVIIADANMDESYSFDGLLAVRRPGVLAPEPIPIAHKQAGALNVSKF